jgi:hypothetical protein
MDRGTRGEKAIDQGEFDRFYLPLRLSGVCSEYTLMIRLCHRVRVALWTYEALFAFRRCCAGACMLKKIPLITALFCGTCFLGMGGGQTYGASITWGPATNISGDSDVSTAGTLVLAGNIGAPGVPAVTVNGVPFGSLGLSGSGIFSTNTLFGSSSTPFLGLSSNYQTLLGSGIALTGVDLSLGFTSLTVGQTYQVEVWSNDSGPHFPPYTTNVSAQGTSSAVGLNDNTTGIQGGLGQFAIGTFVADGSIETLTFSGATDHPLINAIQIRQLSVPLPGAMWAGLSMLGGMGVMRLMRRRLPA